MDLTTTCVADFKLLSKKYKNMEKSCPSVTISHQNTPFFTKSIVFWVRLNYVTTNHNPSPSTTIHHHPPPFTTTHHQPKYIHHDPLPSTTTHHQPKYIHYLPPFTTTHRQPKYIHHHQENIKTFLKNIKLFYI